MIKRLFVEHPFYSTFVTILAVAIVVVVIMRVTGVEPTLVTWRQATNIAPGELNELGQAVFTGPDDFLYAAGNFTGSIHIETDTGPKDFTAFPGEQGIYITKYDPTNLTAVWATTLTTVGKVSVEDIAVASTTSNCRTLPCDPTISIYVSGKFTESLVFDLDRNITLNSPGNFDGFFAKLDVPPSATSIVPLYWAWAREIRGTNVIMSANLGDDSANAIAIDSGNAYITGEFVGPVANFLDSSSISIGSASFGGGAPPPPVASNVKIQNISQLGSFDNTQDEPGQAASPFAEASRDKFVFGAFKNFFQKIFGGDKASAAGGGGGVINVTSASPTQFRFTGDNSLIFYNATEISSQLITCQVNFGDGSPTQTDFSASYNQSGRIPHIYPVAGAYTVNIYCSDNLGNSGSSSTPVIVNDDEQVSTSSINITASPSSLSQGESALINWSGSGVNNCIAFSSPYNSSWNGPRDNPPSVQNFQINQTGIYGLSCLDTNNNQINSQASVQAYIPGTSTNPSDIESVSRISPDVGLISINEPHTYTFTITPAAGLSISAGLCNVDFADGGSSNFFFLGSNAWSIIGAVPHTYTTIGDYTIGVTCSDESPALVVSDTPVSIVAGPSITIENFQPNTAAVGIERFFSFTVREPNAYFANVVCTITPGDGGAPFDVIMQTGAGAAVILAAGSQVQSGNFLYTYNTPNTYNMLINCRDLNNGLIGDDTQPIVVSPPPPGAGTPVTNIFTAKFNSEGFFQWARVADAPLGINNKGLDIAVEPANIPLGAALNGQGSGGHVFVTGSFDGTATFQGVNDTTILTSKGDRDIFVASYSDLEGELNFARAFGSDRMDAGSGIGLRDGQLYITGILSGDATAPYVAPVAQTPSHFASKALSSQEASAFETFKNFFQKWFRDKTTRAAEVLTAPVTINNHLSVPIRTPLGTISPNSSLSGEAPEGASTYDVGSYMGDFQATVTRIDTGGVITGEFSYDLSLEGFLSVSGTGILDIDGFPTTIINNLSVTYNLCSREPLPQCEAGPSSTINLQLIPGQLYATTLTPESQLPEGNFFWTINNDGAVSADDLPALSTFRSTLTMGTPADTTSPSVTNTDPIVCPIPVSPPLAAVILAAGPNVTCNYSTVNSTMLLAGTASDDANLTRFWVEVIDPLGNTSDPLFIDSGPIPVTPPTNVYPFSNTYTFSAGPGIYYFNEFATDAGNNTRFIQKIVDYAPSGPVCPVTITVNPPVLPGGRVDDDYGEQIISATGGRSEPYTFSLVSGNLPGGLSLSPTTGIISGTLTEAGTFTFTIGATDAGSPAICTGTMSYTIVIDAPTGIPNLGISANSGNSIFVAELNPNTGEPIWAHKAETQSVKFPALALGSDSVAVAGDFSNGTAFVDGGDRAGYARPVADFFCPTQSPRGAFNFLKKFTPTASAAEADNDILVIRYDTEGNLLDVNTAGGSGQDFPKGITVANSADGESFFVTGSYSSCPLNFLSPGVNILNTLTPNFDAFLARLGIGSGDGNGEGDEPILDFTSPGFRVDLSKMTKRFEVRPEIRLILPATVNPSPNITADCQIAGSAESGRDFIFKSGDVPKSDTTNVFPNCVNIDPATLGGNIPVTFLGKLIPKTLAAVVPSLSLDVINNGGSGPDKTVIITLVNLQNAVLGVNPTYTLTISSGAGGTSGGGYLPIGPVSSGGVTPPSSGDACSAYLTQHVWANRPNDPQAVMKLKEFLKIYRGTKDLPDTGFYDTQTIQAVEDFQREFPEAILDTPWGIIEPTGNLYLSTIYAANEVACGRMPKAPFRYAVTVTTPSVGPSVPSEAPSVPPAEEEVPTSVPPTEPEIVPEATPPAAEIEVLEIGSVSPEALQITPDQIQEPGQEPLPTPQLQVPAPEVAPVVTTPAKASVFKTFIVNIIESIINFFERIFG